MRIATCFLMLFASAALSDSALAQRGNGPPITEPPSENRLVGYFVGTIGGELRGNRGRVDIDADGGVGFGFRYEKLLSEWFSISPFVEWVALDFEGPGDRFHLFDFDVLLKIRKPVRTGSVTIEFYGGFPVGFTVGTGDAFNDAAVGFNLGALFGAALFFKHKYGVFIESGWRMHTVWNDGDNGLLNQGAIHFGGAFAI